MKPLIAEVLRRISRFQPARKAAHLSGYIAWEKFSSGHVYSVRIRELQSALGDVIHKQLCREIRQDKKLAS